MEEPAGRSPPRCAIPDSCSATRAAPASTPRATLEALLATIDDRGFGGFRATLELESAKIAVRDRRTDEARAHLQHVQELLAHEPDATLARDAAAMLETL